MGPWVPTHETIFGKTFYSAICPLSPAWGNGGSEHPLGSKMGSKLRSKMGPKWSKMAKFDHPGSKWPSPDQMDQKQQSQASATRAARQGLCPKYGGKSPQMGCRMVPLAPLNGRREPREWPNPTRRGRISAIEVQIWGPGVQIRVSRWSSGHPKFDVRGGGEDG